MISVCQLDEFNLWILGIVFLQVGEELLVIAGVDGCCNSIGPLCEHRKHSVVNEVVNQDNPFSGITNEVGYVCPCIPDAAGREDLLGEELGGNVLDSVKNDLDRFVCLLLMLLNVEDSLYNLRVVIDELRYHGKCAHDANVDLHGGVRP